MPASEAASRARDARNEAVEARRAQTGCPNTREHAVETDMCLVRDVLVSEALRVSRALVTDAYISTVECAGMV